MPPKGGAENLIALDLRAASLERGGIGRYTIRMAEAILRLATESDARFCFDLYTARGAEDFAHREQAGIRINRRWDWCGNGILRNGLLLPLSAASRDFDILHSFDYLGPYTFFSRKLIISVHDLIPLHYPELATVRHRHVARWLLPRAVRLADAIVVLSNYVAEDVRNNFPVAGDKTRIIPPGIESHFSPASRDAIEQIRAAYCLPPRYLLFLKADDPKKNIKTAAAALKLVTARKEFADLALAIGGNQTLGFRAEIEQIVAPFAKNLVWLGFVPEAHLAALYSGALALLFPSICEGFGLPILEAMACGCPVITSNVTSIPEVAGAWALCVNPMNVKEMGEAILNIGANDALREKIREGGLEWSRQFTWEKSAAEILELYRELL